MKDDREVWHLSFRAEGEGPPVAIRVRRLLKCALRAFGLRLVGYGPEQGKDATEPDKTRHLKGETE